MVVLSEALGVDVVQTKAMQGEDLASWRHQANWTQ